MYIYMYIHTHTHTHTQDMRQLKGWEDVTYAAFAKTVTTSSNANGSGMPTATQEEGGLKTGSQE